VRGMQVCKLQTQQPRAVLILIARAIEEELLKDLSNKSELSDWFAREEVPAPKKQLPQRPNPKNLQNLEKIAELEEQLKRYHPVHRAM
jgi:kinetochore protein Mis13/DSN1